MITKRLKLIKMSVGKVLANTLNSSLLFLKNRFRFNAQSNFYQVTKSEVV